MHFDPNGAEKTAGPVGHAACRTDIASDVARLDKNERMPRQLAFCAVSYGTDYSVRRQLIMLAGQRVS